MHLRRVSGQVSSQGNHTDQGFDEEDEIAVEDEDFMFIEEIITGYVKDMIENESVNELVTSALNQKQKLVPEQKEHVLGQVEYMHDNFKKVLEFSGFLLESDKKTKEDLTEQINQKAILVDKQSRMQE
jgi:hypothetical protein